MIRKLQSLLLVLVMLSLVGCFGLTKQECLSMNWFQRGYADGVNGDQASSLQSEISQCGKFGIGVNVVDYRRGYNGGIRAYCTASTAFALGIKGKDFPRQCPSDTLPVVKSAWYKGVRQFCTPQNGFDYGRRGESMPTVCPNDLLTRFSTEYYRGKMVYGQIQDVRFFIDQLENELNDLNRDYDDYMAAGREVDARVIERKVRRVKEQLWHAENKLRRLRYQ